jgi:hypothetical protein
MRFPAGRIWKTKRSNLYRKRFHVFFRTRRDLSALNLKQLEAGVRGIFFNNSNIHRGYSEIADVPSSITSE